MPDYVIGINGGGTRTTLVIVDAALKELARVAVGTTNFRNDGIEAPRAHLDKVIHQVTKQAGLDIPQITAIGTGFAGVDRPADHTLFGEMLGTYCPNVIIENDAVPALMAAVGRWYGVVAIAGTGSIAVGANGREKRERSGGWGYYIDLGSGYWMAREAIGAV